MKLQETIDRETGILWEVCWYPEDWDLDAPCRSYCVAPDPSAAAKCFSSNLADIRSVTRVHNGGVYIAGNVKLTYASLNDWDWTEVPLDG
jgi:hypothetical protein